MRSLIAAVAFHSAVVARASGVGTCAKGARRHVCDDGEDGLSALQAPVRRDEPLHTKEALRKASDEVHIITTMNCNDRFGDYMFWQAELLLYSAQYVGQRGPITVIISDCSQHMVEKFKQRRASLSLPEQYKLHFLGKVNTEDPQTMNKPLATAAWFDEGGPERDIVAQVDPDFIFTRPLTAMIEREAVKDEPKRWERVREGVVAASRWDTFHIGKPETNNGEQWFPDFDDWANVSDPHKHFDGWAELDKLQYACTGNRSSRSPCSFVTMDEITNYHSTGPPYIAHRKDWEGWLANDWRNITKRLHEGLKDDYFIDMLAWILANVHSGKRQLIGRSLQVISGLDASVEDTAAIKARGLDGCKGSMDDLLSEPGMPNFIHYTGQWKSWNKFWFDSDNPFELCDNSAWESKAGFTRLLSLHVHAGDWYPFIPCVARRFFAAAIRRNCAGHKVAEDLEVVAAGFAL